MKHNILALHGFMGNQNNFHFLAKELKLLGMNLHTINLPGHDGTPMTPVSSFFNKLTHYIRKNQIDTLYGYSLGGRLALEYLTNRPSGSIKALILESANPGLGPLELRYQRYLADQQLLNSIHDEQSFQLFLTKWYGMDLFKTIHQSSYFQTVQRSRHYNASQIQQWQKALQLFSVGRRPNLWPTLRLLKRPLLYLSGEEDQKYHTIGERIQKLDPRLKHQSFKNHSHCLHLEIPQQLAQSLALFLKKP